MEMELIYGLDLSVFLYLLAIMMFAGIVHGSMGLGFPMVATPLIAVLLDVRLAILLTLLPTVTVNIASIWSGTDQKDSLKEYTPMFVWTLVGALIGSWMLVVFDPSPFRLALALLILLYLWTARSEKAIGRWICPGNTMVAAAFGMIAGISSGITNVMIPILIIYFFSLNIPRSKMIPIFNCFFLIGKTTQILVLSVAGLINLGLFFHTLLPAVVALAGLWVGSKAGNRISADSYRASIHLLLFALALMLIVQFALATLEAG